jgi:hypothetical protein
MASFTLRSLLVVAVVIKLGAGRPNIRGLIAGSGKTIFYSSKFPDSLRAHLKFYLLEPGEWGGGGCLSPEFEDQSAYLGGFPNSRVDPRFVF